MRNVWPRLCLCLCLAAPLLLGGCVGPMMGVGASALTTGVAYHRENTVRRSYPHPFGVVFKAAYATVEDLAIDVVSYELEAARAELSAVTEQGEVLMDIERVTENLTRVSIVAGENLFSLDHATAEAVADDIGRKLE